MLFYITYLLLSPGIWIVLHTVGWLNPKIRIHLIQQYPILFRAAKSLKDHKKSVVIFHAASAGEFEQLKPILKKMDRDKFILVQTFFSPTIYTKESKSPLFDVCCYHPFDFPWSAWIFFKLIKPKYYIITRHDIWPNHVFIAKQLKIQVILINANLHDNSHRLKPMARNANRWIFSKFDKIFTGSERLKKNLINLAMEDKIYVTGDTRFDQVLERRNLNTTRLLPDSFSTSINLIFGSVIASDLEIISETITQYLPEGNSSLVEKNYRLIVVPHETDEETLKLWEDMFKQKNIPSIRYSDADNISNSRAVIIDTVGKLADLYKFGDISYVGAGFGAGVHSVIEPAVYGCVVIFGPNIHILDEAVEMHTEKIAYMVKTFDDLASLLMMFENQDQLKLCQKKTLHYVKSHPLSSMRIISHIFNDEQN